MEETTSPSFWQAMTLMQQGRFDLAVPRWREVVATDPENAQVFAFLALCLCQSGDRKDALAAADRSLELDPGEPDAHYARALALQLMDRGKEAEESIRRAIELEHDDAQNWSLLALIQLGQNRCKDAIQSADEGLEIDPEHVELRSTKAAALTRLGKTAGIDEARQALSEDPNDSYAHTTLGYALLQAQQVQEALSHFREALRLNPDSEYARDGLLEALRARSVVYRPALWYNRWLQQFQVARLLMVMAAIVVVTEIITRLLAGTAAQPWFGLAKSVFRAGLCIAVFSGPLLNAAMRFDRDAKYVLKPRESRMAAITTACILPFIALLCARAFIPSKFLGYLVIVFTPPVLVSMLASILTRTICQRLGNWILGAVMASAILMLVAPSIDVRAMFYIDHYLKIMLVPTVLLWLWDTFGSDKE